MFGALSLLLLLLLLFPDTEGLKCYRCTRPNSTDCSEAEFSKCEGPVSAGDEYACFEMAKYKNDKCEKADLEFKIQDCTTIPVKTPAKKLTKMACIPNFHGEGEIEYVCSIYCKTDGCNQGKGSCFE